MEHFNFLKKAVDIFGKWWHTSKLRDFWHGLPLYKDFMRILRNSKYENWSNRYLLPGELWLDTVDVVVTTKCNLRCK